MLTIDYLMAEIRHLTPVERKQLIALIVDTLIESPPAEPGKRSILEFEGLGAEIWQGIDAQEYVDQLRDEWDSQE